MKNHKRILAALLTSALLAGMTSCGSSTSSTPASSESGSSSQSGSTSQTSEELIPVTLFRNSSRLTSADTDMVKEKIAEITGLDINLNYVSENAQQKFSLLVTDGNIPDINALSYDMYVEYAQQGAFYDITDLIEKYPNIMEYVPDEYWDMVRVDGKIYGIPGLNTEGKYNIYYRGDWLEQLGLDAPANIEEFTEMLRAFTEDDPDQNGTNDTYGYGSNNFEVFYAMFGISPDYYQEVNGEVRIDAISNEYKECLQYLHDQYQAGYIDPEIFTDTPDLLKQKVNQGKIGSFTGWWADMGSYIRDYGFTQAQPDGTLITATPPVDASKGQGMKAVNALQHVVCFSYEDGDFIEKLLGYVDWCCTDMGYRVSKYGVEGVHWAMEDGVLTHNATTDPEKKRLDGVKIEGADVETYCLMERMDIYPELLVEEPFKVGFHQAANNPLYKNLFVGLTSQEYTTYNPDIMKFVEESRVQFILGDRDFAQWDAYVEEYLRIGGLEVAKSLTDVYNTKYGTQLKLGEY